MDRIQSMESFVLTVDSGSLSAAARSLRTSRSHVSRRITELEKRLGTRLLVRTTRHLTLTESGISYYDFCKDILTQFYTEEHHLNGLQKEIQGALRITAPKSFGAQCLSGALTEFAIAHPNLVMSVVLGDFTFGTYDFLERGFDVSIKYSPLANSDLIARRIGTLQMVLCAGPQYAARRRLPEKPTDLEGREYLWHLDPHIQDRTLKLAKGRNSVLVSLNPSFSSNSVPVLRDAALKGHGIAILPLYAVTEDLRAGRLLRVLSDYEVAKHDVYVVHAHRGLVPEKITKFIEHLAKWFAEQSAKREW